MLETNHPQALMLTILLPALACGADAGPADAEPEPTEASSGTEADEETTDGDTRTGGNDDDRDETDGSGETGSDETGSDDAVGPACGDGVVDAGEACDDGNEVDGDGCNRDCRQSGMVVWEHALSRAGTVWDVAVARSGAIYVAGSAETLTASNGWAARLDPTDGAVAWTYELVTPPDATDVDALWAAVPHGNAGVAFGGQHDGHGTVVVLDGDGAVVQTWMTPSAGVITDLAVLAGGDFLVKMGHHAARLADGAPAWTTVVGDDLAYRTGDAVALASTSDHASYAFVGFRRFTLHGDLFESVTFPIADELRATSSFVAWTSTGDVVVAGEVWSTDGAREALVLRSSPGGALRWMHGPQALAAQHHTVRCLAVDSHDAVIVGGRAVVRGELHPFLLKLSAEGEVLWTRSIELDSEAEVIGCTTTPADEVVAVGRADDHLWFAMLTP